MSADWAIVELSEVIQIKYGKDHKKLNDGDVPCYGSGGIMRYVCEYLYDQESILIPRKGSLNNIFYIDEPFWTVDTLFWSIVDKNLADTKFIYYQLKLIDFNKLNEGSAVPSMTVPIINNIKIKLPAINIQKKVSKILSTLDKKIHLNTQTNQTLEQIAQAIFKSWFVDFDPVKAKIAARNALTIQGLFLPSPFGRGAGGEGKKERKNTPPQLLENARNLRQSATDAENLLWKLLRNRQLENCKFRRQHPFARYILDFYCDEYLLVIELDGGQHNDITQKQYDEQRTAYLNQQGIQVLRFWNNEVLQQTEAVLDKIYQTIVQLQSPSPLAPLPKGEGNEEHPSVTLAAMSVISGKDAEQLAQLKMQDANAYQQLAQTAALFPSAMQESELGEIPEGWAVKCLNDICIFNAGNAFKNEFQGLNEGKYPFIKVSDMNLISNEVFIILANNYITEEIKKMIKPKIHEPGSIVFAKIGIALTTNRRRILTEDTIIDNNLMSAKPVQEMCSTCFLYLNLINFDFNTIALGTALPYINVSDLKKLNVTYPSKNLLDSFEAFCTPLFEKINNNCHQNNHLSSIRDSLLPKLLSGEITIPDIEDRPAD